MAATCKPKPIVNHGSTKWLVDLRTQGRGRKFFDTEKAAWDYILTATTDLEEHGKLGALSEADRLEFSAAKLRLLEAGANVSQAVQFFLEHHRTTKPIALVDAVPLFLESRKRANKRERYVRQVGYSLASFVQHFAATRPLVSQIKANDIEAYIHAPGRSTFTRRSYFIDLQTFFNWCVRQSFVVSSPMTSLERITVDDKPPAILTVQQVSALMECAQGHFPRMVPYLTLALFCGIRPEEIQRMTWDDVRLADGHVEVRTEVSKTRKRRLVTISHNALEWLRLGGDVPPVNMRKQRIALCAQTGVKWAHDVCRHSFASYHLAMHGSAEKTSLEMGHHSTVMLFRHYRELVRPADAKSFWEIRPRA